MKRYVADCECGKSHPVTAKQAGSVLACSCGAQVVVPRLSALRVAAGEPQWRLNLLERIQQKIRDGALPSNKVCPETGVAAVEELWLNVQCEATWTRKPTDRERIFWLLLGGMFGWIGVLIGALRMEWRTRDAPAEFGRDTWICVPIRVGFEVREQLRGTHSQRRLRALMRETPDYAELLREFPDATIYPEDSSAKGSFKSR